MSQERSSRQHNLAVALTAATCGLHVHPCRPSKAPYLKGGFHNATSDAEQICEWFAMLPDAVPGLAIPDGVVIVDLDQPKSDGDPSGLQVLQEEGVVNDLEAASIVVATPSGGRHYWFYVDDAERFSNKANVNGLTNVDLRVAGKGYAICPGSELGSDQYDLVKGALEDWRALEPMPSGLDEKLRKPTTTPKHKAGARMAAGQHPGLGFEPKNVSGADRKRLSTRLASLADTIVAGVRCAPRGRCHAKLRNAACTLGGYLHYGAFDEDDVGAALYQASVDNGHVQKDGPNMTRAAIRDGLAWGSAPARWLALEEPRTRDPQDPILARLRRHRPT